jgi:hypothetical protein
MISIRLASLCAEGWVCRHSLAVCRGWNGLPARRSPVRAGPAGNMLQMKRQSLLGETAKLSRSAILSFFFGAKWARLAATITVAKLILPVQNRFAQFISVVHDVSWRMCMSSLTTSLALPLGPLLLRGVLVLEHCNLFWAWVATAQEAKKKLFWKSLIPLSKLARHLLN